MALWTTQCLLTYLYCGWRKTGLFGSFQAAQRWTACSRAPPVAVHVPLYRVAAAREKSRRSLLLVGTWFLPAPPFAQPGVSMIENRTWMPYLDAFWTARS